MSNAAVLPDRAVLIACGDGPYAATLEQFLKVAGLSATRSTDAQAVLRVASRRHFDVVVLDLDLRGQGDLDLVSYLRQRNPTVRIVLLFEMSALDAALEGIRQGAYFYLPKSCPPSDVVLVVRNALRSQAQATAVDQWEQSAMEELVGHSPAMRRVVELARKVAPTDSTVLLLGESGTGKEVLAHALHRMSRRRDAPFVAINCAALPEALLESEMFGHVRGAFTGAERDKRGLFEEADGGTILLDEIGDMALITQAKLLRVLQSGEIRPVGANTNRRVDVRVIAATHRDLAEAVRDNLFREDLYFRLNVIQIRIPPLRERPEALQSLVPHFLARFNAQYGRHVQGLDEQAASLLRHYTFPGNVRELESILAHAVILAEGPLVRAADLPDQVRHGARPQLALPFGGPAPLGTLAEMEAEHIRRVLEAEDGNQTVAAKQLGISRSTLWRKMKEYGIGA
jgi:DNA-binding NtrC family response regulator